MDWITATGGSWYVNWSEEGFVGLLPAGLLTTMSTVEPLVGVPDGGETAVIELSLFTVKLVAALPPKWTEVTPVKPFPLMETVVPPSVSPMLGLTAPMVGETRPYPPTEIDCVA
jgi:hypothetical protein